MRRHHTERGSHVARIPLWGIPWHISAAHEQLSIRHTITNAKDDVASARSSPCCATAAYCMHAPHACATPDKPTHAYTTYMQHTLNRSCTWPGRLCGYRVDRADYGAHLLLAQQQQRRGCGVFACRTPQRYMSTGPGGQKEDKNDASTQTDSTDATCRDDRTPNRRTHTLHVHVSGDKNADNNRHDRVEHDGTQSDADAKSDASTTVHVTRQASVNPSSNGTHTRQTASSSSSTNDTEHSPMHKRSSDSNPNIPCTRSHDSTEDDQPRQTMNPTDSHDTSRSSESGNDDSGAAAASTGRTSTQTHKPSSSSSSSSYSSSSHRRGSAASSASSSSSSAKNTSSSHASKKANNSGDEDASSSSGGEEDEQEEEDTLLTRTSAWVIFALTLSLMLWYLAQPRGRHTSWNALIRHADELRRIDVYNNFAQVKLRSGWAHVGVVYDADTERHVRHVQTHYTAAMQQQQQRQQEQEANELSKPHESSGSDASSSTAHASGTLVALKEALQRSTVGHRIFGSHDTNSVTDNTDAAAAVTGAAKELPSIAELAITRQGQPMAESALYGLGTLMWIAVLFVIPAIGLHTLRHNAMAVAAAAAESSGASGIRGGISGLNKGSGKGGLAGGGGDVLFRLETTCPTRFRDVAGMMEAKKEISEIVDFLRTPELFTRLGAQIPTGALLLGPPGTGKTLLARAVAGESGVGFIPVCGSDFMELYVGMGALRVRRLFEEARKQRCIIYIDEIDAIGLKRQGGGGSGGGGGEQQEREHTLNELLTQLDGFRSGNRRGEVMVLASTNAALEALDPALVRPGRFDRIVHVEAPVLSERVDIFKVHLSKLKLVAEEEEADAGTRASEAPEGEETTNHTIRTDKGKEANQTENVTQDESVHGKATVTHTQSDGLDSVHTTHSGTSPVFHTHDITNKNTSPTITTDTSSANTAAAAADEEGTPVKDKEHSSSSGSWDKKEEPFASSSDTHSHHSSSPLFLSHTADFDSAALLAERTPREQQRIRHDAQRMSQLCPGFVGADIANVCNEAAILAAREAASHVTLSHLERSIDRVLAGVEHRSRVLTPRERTIVAHHEAGHAVAGWFLHRADPLMKVSIIPRSGSALGYAQYLPNENAIRTAQEMQDSMGMTLGGRIAEDIFFDHRSTGAVDDLRKVTHMAYAYVAYFAEDGREEAVGSVYPALGSDAMRYRRVLSPSRADAQDVRAKALVDAVYARTRALLVRHKAEMEALAQHLLTHEVLLYADLVKYLGQRAERGSDLRATGVSPLKE